MQNEIGIDEERINLHEIFDILLKYKLKIIFYILLFTILAAIYAYFKPNIYQSSASIKVTIEDKKESTSSENISGMIDNVSEKSTINTEIDILKSRMLIQKAIQNIDFTHKYYVKYSFKEQELYKASPFEVNMYDGLDLSFSVHHIDEKSYYLKATGTDPISKVDWEAERIYKYGQRVKEKYFEFILSLKDGSSLEPNADYRFKIIDPIKAIKEIQKHLIIVTASKDSSILNITFENNVAVRAYEFTNALVKSYLEEGIKLKKQEASNILDFIDNQLRGVDSKLEKNEQNLKDFKKNSTMMTIGSKTDDTASKLNEYEGKFEEVKLQEEMLDYLYKQIQKNKNFENISMAGLNLEDTTLPDLIGKLQEVQLKLQIISTDYTLSYPKVKKLTKSVAEYKRTIAHVIQNYKESLARKKNLLSKRIEKYKNLMEALPEKEKIYNGLQRNFVVNEKIYSYLLKKRAVVALVKASKVSKNRIVDTALIPDEPIKPNRKLIMMIGFVLGLILGIISSFLSELKSSRFIRDESDIQKFLDVNIYAKLPYLKNKSENIKVFLAPKSSAAEAFRELRTNLGAVLNFKKSVVISLTSSVGGEGKTTTTANLGAVLSLAGRKVILIDADMRKPTLHKQFNLINRKGLSSLLIEKDTLDAVIVSSKYENIDIIPSGPLPLNPSELIDSKNMEEVLEELKKRYDVIIFDTPPIGLITDAMGLMKKSNISLYVVCVDKTRKVFLSKIQRILKLHDIKNLGVLLNCVKEVKNNYGYYEES